MRVDTVLNGAIDSGDILRLDHLTLPITQDGTARSTVAQFAIQTLGASIDPTAKWMHLNLGINQLHLLPHQKENGIIHGRVILCYSNLDSIRRRFETQKIPHDIITVSKTQQYYIRLIGPHGLLLECHLAPKDYLEYTIRCNRFQRAKASLPVGMPVIEHIVPLQTAHGIARYFNVYYGAESRVMEEDNNISLCIVPVGPFERLIFRESKYTEKQKLPVGTRFGGQHICFYVKNFKALFHTFQKADLLFDNENYPEYCFAWEVAAQRQQFRAYQMVDPDTNKPLFALEQEIRSTAHSNW